MDFRNEDSWKLSFSPVRSWWNLGRTAFLMYVTWLVIHILIWGSLSITLGPSSIPSWVLVLAFAPLSFGLIDALWVYYHARNSGRLSSSEAVYLYLQRGYGWPKIRSCAKRWQDREQKGDELIEDAREYIASEEKRNWVIDLVKKRKLNEAIEVFNQAAEKQWEKSRKIEKAFRRAEEKGFIDLINANITFDRDDFPQAAEGIVVEIDKVITRAETLLENARELGVEDSVRDALESGSFSKARGRVEEAQREKELAEVVQRFRSRINDLPPAAPTDELNELIDSLSETRKGSSQYRKIRYDIEQKITKFD